MNRRGNIVLALLFSLLLAASGLALLTHTGLHLKIIAARKDKRLQAAVLEQALLLRLHRYREKLASCDMNAYTAPESDYFNNGNFPDLEEEGVLSRQRFDFLALADGDGFRTTRVLGHIRVGQRGGKLEYAGRTGVDLLAGNIPAGEFGLLVARESEEAAATFLAARGVEYAGTQLPQVGGYAIRSDIGGLLCETLGLPVEVPNWRSIREKFGLEPVDAPIPPGIYLLRGQGEVMAAFVEGDLEKLEFSAGDGWQAIAFSRDGRRDELRYRPGLQALTWSGGDGLAVAGALFAEKIIVHGSVWAVEQVGAAAFLDDSRIELLGSGRMVIASKLESENLELGKEKFPGLLLMTCGSDLLGGGAVNADVVIDVAGAATIQAQVIAAGKLVNMKGQVEITGGLFAGDIENAGRLHVGALGGRFAFADHVRLPDFKLLKNFRVHFIQEAADE